MSSVTITWSTIAACSLLLAFMYGVVWAMDRKAWSNLAFSLDALAVVGTAMLELQMMMAGSAESWGTWVRWIQIPIFLHSATLAVFIRLFFGTGRPWLMWTIIGMRFFILVTGFLVDPNFNFSHIDSIERIPFLGDEVTVVGVAGARNLQWIATLELVLMLIYVADASIQLWRRGGSDFRRKALVIGGAAFATNLLESLYSQLMILFGLHLPALLSPPYLLMLAAMTVEMSRDTLRATRLARELRASESRLDLAASAAGLALWSWEAPSQRVWFTGHGRAVFGLAGDDAVTVDRVLAMIEPGDAERARRAFRDATARGGETEIRLRVRVPDGGIRWVLAHGQTETDASGRLRSAHGVLRDITEQEQARQEIDELRRELAHAGRVSMLGTLSSSLAHELSQPLGAILLNAEAGELLMKRDAPDLDEIRKILADIRRDDTRAADVIDRLRKLLKRRALEFAPAAPGPLLQDVVTLLKSDAIARHVTLDCQIEEDLPPIRGDRVHLSQVLINLAMNGMDAVSELPTGNRHVTLRARSDGPNLVELSVSDSGTGIAPDNEKKVFEPFFTTKPNGMGMGLSVSRTIIEAHGGRLWAETAPIGGGGVFKVLLPTFGNESAPD